MEIRTLSNYSIICTIGSGGFGKIFLAIHNPTATKVAIKQISKLVSGAMTNGDNLVRREVDIMNKTDNPFIADLFEYIETEENYYLVIEYCENNTLLNMINTVGPLTESEASRIFSQLILAVKHLHEDCNIAHRDIKAENILFDANNNVKLIDFGLSNTPNDARFMKTQCGSPTYASPEVIIGRDYTFSCDIWSCGVVLYAMVCGYLPFHDENMSRLAQKIVYSEVEYPTNLSNDLIDLLKKMLTKNFSKRITIDEIVSHPWVEQQISSEMKFVEGFKQNEQAVLGSLDELGFDSDKVKQDVANKVYNVGTVSYKIMSRCYLNECMNHCILNPGYLPARRSSADEQNLPPLEKKDSVKLPKPKTMPVNPKKPHCLRKIIPHLLIRLH